MPSTTVQLPEKLTMREGRATLASVLPKIQASSVTELDASHLKVLDSAAIALLLACQREARTQGRKLHIVGVPEKLRKLAQLYGVDELLEI
jgi:phospholipid transport system transporter-binding protein